VEHSEIVAEIYPLGFRYFVTRNAAGAVSETGGQAYAGDRDGVFELKDSDERTWYRMIYLARKNDVIFVLDCFEKDSRRQRSTT